MEILEIDEKEEEYEEKSVLNKTKEKIDEFYSHIYVPSQQFCNVRLFSKPNQQELNYSKKQRFSSENYLKDIYEWKYKKKSGKEC